ncbi:hypothetical protein MHH60_28380 [Paenibacillus sp. FSL H7-0716]|uniref:RCK N-terminal domain-containing protein n=1 Tax=Paenibacillus odorifer TaxID=189426 RepID=A0A1R0XY96_9BACL|nr:hypothetical protein [Paenibacillus odorifer]OMD40063.1 hypothetical protein BSK52_14305 [Paenibacillus odorifer]OME19821.1 hypothetical protein BSK47_14715 [Paenibacillus odorifer]
MVSHDNEFIVVSAPNKAGVQFIKTLKFKGVPFAAITNNETEKSRLEHLGVKNLITVDTTERERWIIPELSIGKVFLFERSLPLCCKYIQICRSWTGKPIYVITESSNSRLIYKGLGANYVIHSNSDDVSFLLD